MKALPRLAARISVALALVLPVTAEAAPCAGFTDVDDTSPFCVNVAWLKNRAITLGCTATLYCPNDPVTRLQMAIFMNRLADSLFPLTCAAGQVMKWNGAAWACSNDNAGSGAGTLTSVMAGTGLQGSPNPITSSGSLNLAPGYQLPQSCANGQVPKSNGSGGWACAADNAGGTGTVTSVATGAGLTGGPVTTAGTIAADTTYLQRRVSGTCAAGSSIRSINTDGTVVCESDDVGSGGSGTVTSVTTGTGLAGGPITTSGTLTLATGYRLPQSCSNGQVAKSNGAGGWICAVDGNSGGTVTSVASGTGLTGGPITGTGTLAVNTATIQSRVTGTCAAGSSIRTINGDGTVVCEADDVGSGGSGTVTSVATGTGLTGGPITTTGTLAVNTTTIQARVTGTCAAGSSIRTINTDGTVVCEVDDGGAASAFVQGGNAFGATASLGTNDTNALELRAGNARVMRYEPSPFSPNVVGGSPANVVTGTVRGATIAGGGVPAGDNDPTLTDEAPNRVTDIYGTVGGGYANRAGDATGTVVDGRSATVAGGSNNIASAQQSAIGGGNGNSVSSAAPGGVIAGGIGNAVFGTVGAIGGGINNISAGTNATVGGGSSNFADGLASTIAGGTANTASGIESTVVGGGVNFAIGIGSTVAGGELNTAGGAFSFATGRRAKVRDPVLTGDVDGDEGTFVWADSTDADFESSGPNQFLVRASGGVGINTSQPGAALHVKSGAAAISPPPGSTIVVERDSTALLSILTPSTAQGGIAFGSPTSAQDGGMVYDHPSRSLALRTGGNFNRLLIDSSGRVAIARASTALPLQIGTSGGNGNGASLSATGIWTNASSRTFKQGFEAVDVTDVLERVAAMPITSWSYTGDDARHIGPTAEDFKSAFGLGGDPRYIGTVDADGVALAAIQGLNAKLETRLAEKDGEIAALKATVDELRAVAGETTGLKSELAELRRALNQLRRQAR